MHFGFYLMIVALVVMGLEAIYALDQLATSVLQVPRAERYLIMSATIRRTGDARAALAMTPVLRRGGVYARHRVLPVASSCECTGIISCSLSLPGNMTKGCVGSLTSRSRR